MTGIRDLARHLNISIGTVSRALNNRPGVNEKTKSKVLKAADELGYAPNQAGRSLRKGNTNVIGFVLETGGEGMLQGDLFFIRVLDGMQSVLSQHGLNLVALMTPSKTDPEAYLRQIVARGFTDGLVLSATRRRDPRISYLAAQKLPFATLGRSLTDGGQPWFDLDFEGLIADAIGRLAAKGHQKIALALPRADLNLRHIMRQSYDLELAGVGIVPDPRLVIETESGEDGGALLARKLVEMDARPTAVIFTDPILPFGLYRGLQDMGLTPGRDLGIIGVGTRLASLLSPDLTHYRFNLFDLGARIGEAMVQRLENGAEAVTFERVPFSLVEGASI